MGDYKNHVVFVPFNEPEGNMFGTGGWSFSKVSWLNDPQYYFEAWREVYHLIKALDPDARTAGPNTSVLYNQVKGLLQYAKANDVVPDVMTWHELSSPAPIRTNVAKYRQMEKDVGVGPLPINVNEYGHNYHLSVPGQVVQWVSAIEESKIDVRSDVRPHGAGDRPAPQPAVHPPGRRHARREQEAVEDPLRRQGRRRGRGLQEHRPHPVRHDRARHRAGGPVDRPGRRLGPTAAAGRSGAQGRCRWRCHPAHDRHERDVGVPGHPLPRRQRRCTGRALRQLAPDLRGATPG